MKSCGDKKKLRKPSQADAVVENDTNNGVLQAHGNPYRPVYSAARFVAFLILSFVILATAPNADAGAVRTNPGFLQNSIPRNDDGSTSNSIPIGFEVDFFGLKFTSAYVNNNGNITFGGPLATFTPQGLSASPLRIIAPFWADVDTRASRSELVTYGQDTVNGRRAFGANYVNVGYFGSHDDKLNSFQLILIDRSDLGPGNFDIEFNYDRIDWETGDASGGSGGFGGTPASAGYSNGTLTADGSFEILGSRQRGIFLDSSRFGLIYRSLNSGGVRGRVVFFVRSGNVECSYSTLSIDQPFPWEGGQGAVQVAAPSQCPWSVTSNAGFITIPGDSNRRGSGIVDYIVAENRGPARSGRIIVAGESYIVVQDGFQTLRVNPPTVSISTAGSQAQTRISLRVEAIRDPVIWAAAVTVKSGGAQWRMQLTPATGIASVDAPSTVVLQMENPLLLPSSAVAEILVWDTIFGPSVAVPVILGTNQLGAGLELSQSSFFFQVPQAGAAPPAQTLQLSNTGDLSLGWTIDAGTLIANPWLNFSPTSGVAPARGSGLSNSTVSVNPAGLSAGIYQALVPIHAAGAVNSPQLVSVTLRVVAASTASSPESSTKGFVFASQQGGVAPPAQNLTISNTGAGQLLFQLSTFTDAGGPWLTVSPPSGSAAPAPASVQVRANPAGLAAGIYRGRILANYSTGSAQEINVTFIVASTGRGTLFSRGECTPQGMDVIPTTVTNGANYTVSVPQPLLAWVVDSCGLGVRDATLLADVEGITIPLESVGSGLYEAQWLPSLASTSAEFVLTAMHGAYGTIQRSFLISISSSPTDLAYPVISTNGVVESAGFTPGGPLAPGGMISVFGTRFATIEASSTSLPLQRQLAGVSLRIGGEDAPLFYVGPTQINAQVPYGIRPGANVSIVVNSGGKLSAPQSYLVVPARPGLFSGDGFAAALDGQSRRITATNPARRGNALQLFAAGLGLTDPQPQSGAASPPSSSVRISVRVKIGGVEVPVTYQGLAPGSVGLYQINVVLLDSVPVGNEVPVVIEQDGLTSNPLAAVRLPVR